MDDNELRAILKKAARQEGGKETLACAQAFELAARHGVPLKEIGRACDREGIRVRSCQLGMFK